MPNYQAEYDLLAQRLADEGINVAEVEARLKAQKVETPSWGYADSGTRFGAFRMAGAPRSVYEKFEDAAQAHKYTGIAPGVAIHIPWDTCADWKELSDFAQTQGVSVGAVNPNVFQDNDYRFGSLGSAQKSVRDKAVAHVRECVEIMNVVGSPNLSLWFADGTNFPGQADMRRRKRWFAEGLAEVYADLTGNQAMLLEYKPFEPAFYHTDIADWGMAYAFCQALGERAKVLVDLGHHLPGANIEHIVAFLLDEGRLGGFHFNNRKYADDDLTTGSINPYELYLIYTELVAGENDGLASIVAYMIDESHTLKNKIAEMIQSLVALQTSYAKALLVNQMALTKAREADNLIAAEEVVKSAFATDIRPLLWKVRSDLNLPDPADPVRGFVESGYIEAKAKERGIGGGAGLGA
jgi:L-rhamnose isomerase/sugar isomerase